METGLWDGEAAARNDRRTQANLQREVMPWASWCLGSEPIRSIAVETLVQLYDSVRIVLDTSALIAVLTGEPSAPDIVRATWGTELVAPASLPWEFGNAISSQFRRGRVTPTAAADLVRAFERLPVSLVDVPLGRAIEVMHDTRLYAYDAYMLVCAEALRAPLLTLDRQLTAAAITMGIPIIELSI